MNMTTKEKNFISAVVYMYNNGDALKEFLPVLYNTLNAFFEHYEIVCVNDGTEDDAVEIVKSFSLTCDNPIISIVNMGMYQGMELAMNAGVDVAIGDFVYEFDNLQLKYSSDLIMNIYYKSLEGNDIVMASPEHTVGFLSKAFYKIFNTNSKMDNRVVQDVFHIISRRAINRVEALNKTVSYRKAAYSKCGLKCTYINFDNKLLKHRQFNKKIKKIRQDVAFESLVLFTDFIQKLSARVTLLFLLFTIAVGVYSFAIRFSANKPIEGWTFTILFLSISFFGVFLLLTIILKYMSILLNIVYKRQRYLVDSIEKITNN